MASAVAEFYDPSTGRLQVSADMLGFVCKKTGSGTAGARSGGNTNTSTITIDTTGFTYPIIALRTNGYAAALYGANGGSNSANFASNGAVGSAYTYYIFEWTPALPTNTALFQLYRENGQCSFSSNYWPMKIVQAFPMDDSGVPSPLTVAGKTFAYACNTVGGHSHCPNVYCYDSGGPQLDPNEGIQNCKDIRGRIDGKIYGAAINDNGTTVTPARVSVDDVLGSFGRYVDYQQYGDGWAVPNKVLAIDVTGIPIGATFF